MPAPEGYHGQAYSLGGDKSRYVLPPAFRKAVKECSGGSKTLCLQVHDTYDCLVGFGLSRIEQLHAQLEKEEERAIRLGQGDFDPDARAQQLFGFEQVPFDDSGRFVMPDHLRELGKAGEGLYFHGAGRFFFVWDPEELERMGDDFRGAKASCRAQREKALAKAGAKGKGA
ncbi:division/cell wall cluster transcriptional repressor MraZ [Erythrobacter sp.]|uniref:division/cell wall cluster transcriptional repressor MraZ n=1 Tax=Erythrobacter sp. TaxID=1042 RepID=UPI002EB69239|nr:division/cell wall cluster transcriptional repressor MraZ [Erythrobacter sp.]